MIRLSEGKDMNPERSSLSLDWALGLRSPGMLKKRLGVRPDIQASHERLHIHLMNIEQLSSYHSRLAGTTGNKTASGASVQVGTKIIGRQRGGEW